MGKFKVGQIWKAKDGQREYKIVCTDNKSICGIFPIKAEIIGTPHTLTFTEHGRFHGLNRDHFYDLATLIQDVPEVSNTVPKSTETETSLQDPSLRNENKQGKLPLHLVPPTWEEFMALVFEFGAKKYPADSWRKYTNVESFLASARRHILYFRKGEDYDPESGLHHLMHSAWNLLALLSQIVDGKTETRRAKMRKNDQ